ncbi:nitrate reductase molybdenum cofactor assembly chaperone [Paraburkholderia acidiphila]|uniref:Nitrate reductase molybdenum cofactor assembly chaperone n=1 Tax=Paraburkholderia acidiphila TaxID=2571747 RepID=A0A7Z2J731_9BURK|nr:nitrate reductase molybdenum cofactor assembly chaperone [Paraburkholderia acidiphila]QGZ53706.1 nitrate reductase molybdenum cofactor assembly chaperone [Paraburkholderia acidiphila]
MSIYPVLSALLDYPEQPLLDALDAIDAALEAVPNGAFAARELAPLIAALRERSLVESQEAYVATFDRNPRHSLHLFEHVHGESRARGQAMVDLLDEYRNRGFDVATNELPDYVPLFLEVLGLIGEQEASALLGEAIHVLAALGNQLEKSESPYSGIFTVLCELSDVEPLPLVGAPVRDMDEALERFGTGADGVEPLMHAFGASHSPQVVQFHPRAEFAAAAATTSARSRAACAKESP